MVISIVAICLVAVCGAATVLPAMGLVGINPFLGLRTAHTMSSSAAWKHGHVVGAKVYAPFAIVGLIFGTIGLFSSNDLYGWFGFAAALVGAVAAGISAHKSTE